MYHTVYHTMLWSCSHDVVCVFRFQFWFLCPCRRQDPRIGDVLLARAPYLKVCGLRRGCIAMDVYYVHVCIYMVLHVYSQCRGLSIYMLMRDVEGRKKEASMM